VNGAGGRPYGFYESGRRDAGASAPSDETRMIAALARKLSACKTRSPYNLPATGLSNPGRVTIFPELCRLPQHQEDLNDRDPRL
jgi:hypothetical protein